MTIHNYSFIMSTKKLEQTINLLPKEYTDIDIPVYIFSNNFAFNAYCFVSNLMGDSNFTKGDYNAFDLNGGYLTSDYTGKSLKIVLFKANNKVIFLNSLFHEIRHAYQSIYLRDMFVNGTKEYITSESNHTAYRLQKIEIDANRFASNSLRKYRRKLCDIHGISYDRVKFTPLSTRIIKYKEIKKKLAN